MSISIYVGNLAWAATADDLLGLFGKYGKVIRTQVITDRDTGRSRGFGFVEMENDGEARLAVDGLNGWQYHHRPLIVNEAQPRRIRGQREDGSEGNVREDAAGAAHRGPRD